MENSLLTAVELFLASELRSAKERAAAALEAGALDEHEKARRDVRRALDRFADFVLRGIVPEEVAAARSRATRETLLNAA